MTARDRTLAEPAPQGAGDSADSRQSPEERATLGAAHRHEPQVDDVMASERFLRQVGRRRAAPRSTAGTVGLLPDADVRQAWTRMAQYRTRVPKGVFIYPSHEAANRDWQQWQLEAMRLAQRDEGDG